MFSKRQINFFLQKVPCFGWLYSGFVKLNLILFHWNERCHYVCYGKDDPDKKYYVIRSRGKTEGLLSSVFGVVWEIGWAKQNGYIPYVDFSNSLCQYHVDRLVNGTDNAWEYFFLQPEKLTLSEVKTKKNVLVGGWKLFGNKKAVLPISSEQLQFQPYVLAVADDYFNENFKDKKVLGVFIRGTDYVSLRPKGHSVQPTIEAVREKISEYDQKYRFDKIYVVTEDYEYYKRLTSAFGNKICSFGDSFVKSYKGSDYVSVAFDDDPYERGLNYLLRILILSKCDYTICSKASGSEFAKFIRKKIPIDEYWFELGVY